MSTNKKITQLDELTPTTWADDDVIAIVDISAQETKKIQLSTFRTAVGGVTTLTATTPLTVDTSLGDVTISVAISGGGTVNAVLDEDNMASNSPTALSTQQSIKAYVDSQIITVDSLSEVLALGNTTGGTDLSVSTGDDITFADNSKAIFGAGSDLQIYHNGANSVIKDAGTGILYIAATTLNVTNTAINETTATFSTAGAATLYFANASKFATTATGVDVTGTIVGDGLTLTTGATVTTVLDEDNMASNSATALATQQSIKAYVDSQVGTVDTLAEILANGNTSGGTNIVVSSGDVITTNTINETTAASGVTIDSLLVKDGGITAAGTSTFAGQTITDLGAVTTADINGGTIDGTVIGGASAAAGTFTTFTSTGINDDATSTAITINSSENVGIGTASPAVPLDVVGNIRSSTGVLFGTDTAAANLLDDYEEGDWTPTIGQGATASSDATYNGSFTAGKYTKIGRIVHCSATLRLTDKGTQSGAISILGLPFASANNVGSRATWSFFFHGAADIDLTGNVAGTIMMYHANNASNIIVRVKDPATAAAENVEFADISDTVYVQISGSYVAA
tara:strand:+ start:130 stop:1842 length:1713 start_codon:yes stop_codon:yes gene_type:complete